MYNTKTGYFRCVNKWYVIIRGDSNEVSYSYGYDEERSKILCSSFKLPLQNIFQVTAFEKHAKKLIEEKQTQEASDLLFFLPSTTDCKEKIYIFFGNVNLHPIDCAYNHFINYSDKNHLFLQHHLDSGNSNEKEIARKIFKACS